MNSGGLVLAHFPYPYGIYRHFKRARLIKMIRFGWRVISSQEDGRVLMWWGRRVR